MPDPKVLAVARGTLDADVTAETPPGNPDVRVVVVSAVQMILVRVARTYLQSLLGFLGAAAVGALDTLAPMDAWGKIVTAAGLALFPAFVSLVQNVLEWLTKLDTRAPELRG